MTQDIKEIADHLRNGRPSTAERKCRQLLAKQPQNPFALHLLGVIASAAGAHKDAVNFIQKAIGIRHDIADFHNSLGAALGQLGRAPAAISAFRHALQLNPKHLEALVNISMALKTIGSAIEAVPFARRAVELSPSAADHSLAPGTLHPTFGPAASTLALILEDNCEMEEALLWHRRAAASSPSMTALQGNVLYGLYYVDNQDPQAVLEEHVNWARKYAERHYHALPLPSNDPIPHRRLRVGYISADFRQHSVATFLLPLILYHNREEWEVWCYSDVTAPDCVSQRFKSACHTWQDIRGLTDARVAEMIRNDQIDVLIDPTGHMGNNRIMVFARKPAPVQITFPGYPGTTGLSVMDGVITDQYQDPPHRTEHFYTERLVRVAGSPRCYTPPDVSPAPTEPPATRSDHITFGVLQRPSKMTPRMFRLWSQLLARVPGSRLALLLSGCSEQDLGSHVLTALQRYEISEQRVELLPRQPTDTYFSLFQRVDIVLDTFPYNGCTTTCDALWMGVPVVTLGGSSHVSRVGVSILSHLGALDWIADSEQMYVEIAAKLATDVHYLRELRVTLRERMRCSPLMDAKRVAADFEKACWEMWREWCEKQHIVDARSSKS